jgi:hypothetical protein
MAAKPYAVNVVSYTRDRWAELAELSPLMKPAEAQLRLVDVLFGGWSKPKVGQVLGE